MIALYSKTAGKNAKHAAIPSSSNISALSRITVQVFEHMTGLIFRTFPSMTAPFGTKGFLHVTSYEFLAALSKGVKEVNGVEVATEDLQMFQKLKRDHARLKEAIKLFTQRTKRAAN